MFMFLIMIMVKVKVKVKVKVDPAFPTVFLLPSCWLRDDPRKKAGKRDSVTPR